MDARTLMPAEQFDALVASLDTPDNTPNLARAFAHGCSHPDSWFSRTLCAEPCGAMHNYCTECGACVDECAA